MAHMHRARILWWGIEPYHAVVYFAPDAKANFEAGGLKGFWMGYFASRAAPLGAVPAEVVTAVFYNFHPAMVARALPAAWALTTPTQITAARLALADRTLRHWLGEATIHSSPLAEAANLARQVAVAASPLGRPLFASYTSLPWPQEPHLVLWHAATLLREYRGDGHVACLVHAHLDACEAHLLAMASGVTTQEILQLSRRWTDQDWAAARARLQQRGWLDAQGGLTPTGAAAKRHLEEHTDTLAAPPLDVLSEVQQARLIELVQSLGRQIVHAGGVPFPNPMGLPATPYGDLK
jgi:Helix-turn-helix family